MKILAIGNSFSDDATAFLRQIGECGGADIEAINLFIGGCSLKTHVEKALTGRSDYIYERNGVLTERMISLAESLAEENWDIVTIQQASCDSGIIDTYFPYAEQLLLYVREKLPEAKVFLHETWAYEIDSTHPAFPVYENSQTKMADMIRETNITAASRLGTKIIPAGEVIRALRGTAQFDYSRGGTSLCRDGFHLNLIYGRYAAAAAWYEKLLGLNILENSFVPDGADASLIRHIRNVVHETVAAGLI